MLTDNSVKFPTPAPIDYTKYIEPKYQIIDKGIAVLVDKATYLNWLKEQLPKNHLLCL